MTELTIESSRRTQMIDITSAVQQVLGHARVGEGLVCVYVPHTTAAVTINEHADPDVADDLLRGLERMVPEAGYRHGEGNSRAHIMASLIGSGVTVPVHSGRLALGTWQGIFFCEFDGPRRRKVYVQTMAKVIG